MPSRWKETLGVPVLRIAKRRRRKEREGKEEERYFFPGPAEENLRGAKAQEGKGPTLT
jgi:hypothetical protein